MNYYINLGGPKNNQNQQQQDNPPQTGQVDQDTFIAQCNARTRQINAEARLQETFILLNGMAEIRCALNIPSVADNDTGQSERAPLKPMFEPEQVSQLQYGYVRMMEKYFKFVDHVMREDYKITAPKEHKPEQ